MKVKLSEIKLTQLNNNCIALISKFSRVLKAHNGSVLRLNDPNVVSDVFAIQASDLNPQLKQLRSRLKKEIKNHLLGDNVEESSFHVYEVVGERAEELPSASLIS